MSAIFSLLGLTRQRLATISRITELRSAIVRGFNEDIGRRELYNRLSRAGLDINANDFFRYSERVYAHLARATSVRDLSDSDPFLITRLPQENLGLPSRFWARVRIEVSGPRGARQEFFRTFNFSEKMTIGELKGDVTSSYSDYFRKGGRNVSNVEVLELYKQF